VGAALHKTGKRAINKIINDKSSLFNNLELIDKKKLKEAGLS